MHSSRFSSFLLCVQLEHQNRIPGAMGAIVHLSASLWVFADERVAFFNPDCGFFVNIGHFGVQWMSYRVLLNQSLLFVSSCWGHRLSWVTQQTLGIPRASCLTQLLKNLEPNTAPRRSNSLPSSAWSPSSFRWYLFILTPNHCILHDL